MANPPIPEITYEENFIEDHESLFAALLTEVDWLDRMNSRLTACMGVPYNYPGASYPEMPWHPRVLTAAQKVAAHVGFEITNCILNLYPTGDHIVGWHRDLTDILHPGTPIAVISLGCERSLSMRTVHNGEFHYVDQPLKSGSLFTMSNAMQDTWKHAIRKDASTTPRISLTLRHITHVPPRGLDDARYEAPIAGAVAEMVAAETAERTKKLRSESDVYVALMSREAMERADWLACVRSRELRESTGAAGGTAYPDTDPFGPAAEEPPMDCADATQAR